ncbi:MAG: hypothetical protein RIC30_11625 [Marinoscillum sp.]|uniref:hypothetical protein n=1 Tax=Marinoscillum sp. TaxID=2024838 RepID=UPI0032F2FB12
MKYFFPLLLVFLLSACYSIPKIEGFDKVAWGSELSCNANRLSDAQLLVSQQDKLLGEGQAEIKLLLGAPDEHELYNRNQKFFYYNLTPSSGCENGTFRRLSVKFDALDRVKEVMIIE